MRHYYRSHTPPAEVLVAADSYFTTLGLTPVTTTVRARTFSGDLGAVKISARAEGGHYTFVEGVTDQVGESRLDRNVKKFFVELHRAADPSHTIEASY
jgi:hypothetical protein